jgi:hypothetical protein
MQTKEKFSLFRICAKLVIGLLRIFSVPLEMLSHSWVGERYMGLAGWLGIIGICEWGALWPHSNYVTFNWLLGAYAVRIAIYKFSSDRDGTPAAHSRYPGHPFFGWFQDRFDPEMLRGSELLALFGLGALIRLADEAVGNYLLAATSAMLVVSTLQESIARDRVLDKLDAQLEEEADNTALRAHLGNGCLGSDGKIQFEVRAAPRLMRTTSREISSAEPELVEVRPEEGIYAFVE